MIDRNITVNLFAALVIGSIIGVFVTEVFSRWIYFSLFLGIPVGIMASVLVYVCLESKRNNKKCF